MSGRAKQFLSKLDAMRAVVAMSNHPTFFATGALKITGKGEMLKEHAIRRIAVIGAGAVGSALGALLHRTGQRIVLIARPAHIDAIRQDGLRVDGDTGNFIAPVEATETLDFRPDLALLTVKTQDVIGAVKAYHDFLNDVPVVTFQNGVHSDELVASLLSREQILSAVVLMHATYLLPGKVTVVYQGKLILGRPFGPRDSKLEDIAHILNQAVPTRVTDNVQGAHWLKLVVNLNNALPAITNHTMSQVYANALLARHSRWSHARGAASYQSSKHPARVLTRCLSWLNQAHELDAIRHSGPHRCRQGSCPRRPCGRCGAQHCKASNGAVLRR